LMPMGASGVCMGQGHETFNIGGQKVKVQGHARTKIDLETWQRHHYDPLGWVAFLVCDFLLFFFRVLYYLSFVHQHVYTWSAKSYQMLHIDFSYKFG